MKKLSLQFSTDSIDHKPKGGPTAFLEETTSTVINFLMKDDTSYKAPAKRDTIFLRSNGQKKITKRQHLTVNIGEVYELIKMEYPEAAVRMSNFVSLRPEHILVSSQILQNVGVCQKHENISLILQALQNLEKKKCSIVFTCFTRIHFM